MEHSTLHAFLLIGLILSLGGPLAAMLLRGPTAPPIFFEKAARATAGGALLAALATLADLAVQVAEVEGRTVFGGVELETVVRFAIGTTVGRLCLARAAALVLTAALAWRASRRWTLVGLAAFGAVLLTALLSHAAAQPERRTLAIGAQVLHVAATAAWIGVLLHVFFLRGSLATEPALAGKVVRRFSPIALSATTTILITGVIALLRSLHSPGAVLGSAYGWTLLVKLTLIVPAVLAGWINFRHVGPELARSAAALPRFARMLELEVIAGVLVVIVAGILGSISPPGEDGSLCLAQRQARALLSRHFPQSHVEDWTVPDD